jgi:hypothetical protein
MAKLKVQPAVEAEPTSTDVAQLKKKKKVKADAAVAPDGDDNANGVVPEGVMKKKKRATADGVDGAEPAKKKAKKAAVATTREVESEGNSCEGGEDVVRASATIKESLDAFDLCDGLKSLLRSQGIETLFAIQAQTLPAGLTGKGKWCCSAAGVDMLAAYRTY